MKRTQKKKKKEDSSSNQPSKPSQTPLTSDGDLGPGHNGAECGPVVGLGHRVGPASVQAPRAQKGYHHTGHQPLQVQLSLGQEDGVVQALVDRETEPVQQQR